MHRYTILDAAFAHLAKPDEGLGQFRAMLHSLINWTHFDSYYFENLKKLDRAEAERAITHLKQLQEIRDHKLQDQRREREKNEAAAKVSVTTLPDLKEKFISLLQGTVIGASGVS